MTTVSRRQLLGGVGAAAAAGAVSGCTTASYGSKQSYLTNIVAEKNNNTVFHWVDILLQQVRDQRVAPPRAALNYAAPMVAGFIAANGIIGRYEDPYGLGEGPKGADPEVAYGVAFATAAADAMQQPFLAERLAFKAKFADSEAKTLGEQWGRRVGLAIVKMRTADGAEPSKLPFYFDNYKRRDDVLRWSPTSPTYSAMGQEIQPFQRPLFPSLGQVKPWTMKTSSQFRSAPFPDARSPEFAEDFHLLRTIGGKDSKERTADQTEIAIFWEDGPNGITPPGHFIYLPLQVLQDRGIDFLDMARYFALIGSTSADSAINAWDNKYFYDILRPESAIRFRADKMNNPDKRVACVKGWQSVIPTPNFPAYTSGHSTFGAAGCEMLRLILGTDNVSFSHESPDQNLFPVLTGRRRYFTTLYQAEWENGWSRLFGGVHWRHDHEGSTKAGYEIARHAFKTMWQRKV